MNKAQKERLVKEQEELNDKANKLQVFILSPAFVEIDEEDKKLLLQQRLVMLRYAEILEERRKRLVD